MSARRQAILGCVLLSLALAGCFKPHRAPVAQGNVIMKEDAERLEVGMSRSQVEYLLGRPILKEPFSGSRWNYVFYLRIGHNKPAQNRVSLHFEGDTLARIEGDLQATGDRVVENQLEQDAEEEFAEDDEEDLQDPPADPADPGPPPDPRVPPDPGTL